MKKLLNKKGFTLMEMLIVVAIIVILAAISIPTFSGSLDKANEATDAANIKAAKASFVAQSMLESDETGYIELNEDAEGYAAPYYYDFEEGVFMSVGTNAEGAANEVESVGSCKLHTEAYITLVDSDNDKILDTVQWSAGPETNCEEE